MGFQTQALRLQGNGSAAREGVEHRGKFTVVALADLLACPTQQWFVVAVLSHHQLLHESVQPGAFGVLLLDGRELLRSRGGIVDELREQHGAGGREWFA